MNSLVVNRKKAFHPSRFLLYVFIIFISAVFLIPFYWMIATALKTASAASAMPPKIFPDIPLQWENFSRIFLRVRLVDYMKNTVVVATLPVVGQLLVTPMIAYSLAKVPWKGAKIIFPLVLATMMIPWQVTQIPMYATWSKLGFVNTYIPLVLPHFFGTAYQIFLMRQFVKSIPDALLDAARIDGSNEIGSLFRIIYPLCKPVLVTIGIMVFISGWNDLNGPLLYLQRSNMYTLSIGLQVFTASQVTTREWHLMMAAATLFTVPLIIIFFIGQKQFVGGIVTTGMKG